MNSAEKEAQAQAILAEALLKIRDLGLAPKFKWGQNCNGLPNLLAVNIQDFVGFHELSEGVR